MECMPAKRTSAKKTDPQPEATTAVEPTAAGEQLPADEAASSEDEVFVPANRAERRANGKGKAANQPTSRGGAKVSGGHGPAHAQRMWANRRSGG